jgi:hypothetical protein
MLVSDNVIKIEPLLSSLRKLPFVDIFCFFGDLFLLEESHLVVANYE